MIVSKCENKDSFNSLNLYIAKKTYFEKVWVQYSALVMVDPPFLMREDLPQVLKYKGVCY